MYLDCQTVNVEIMISQQHILFHSDLNVFKTREGFVYENAFRIERNY